MRRATAAFAVTMVVLYLVLSFKSSPLPRPGALNTTAPSTSAPPDTTSQPPAGAPPPDTAATSTVVVTAPPATTSPTTAAGNGTGPTRTVNGQVVQTRYGDVQVAVVLSGTRIVDVRALQLPFDRPRSVAISQQAAPVLRQEVLDAQSAQIDTVSGASYTSDGYAQSLQAALDAARG